MPLQVTFLLHAKFEQNKMFYKCIEKGMLGKKWKQTPRSLRFNEMCIVDIMLCGQGVNV